MCIFCRLSVMNWTENKLSNVGTRHATQRGGAAFEHAPGEEQVGACVHARVAGESTVFI